MCFQEVNKNKSRLPNSNNVFNDSCEDYLGIPGNILSNSD